MTPKIKKIIAREVIIVTIYLLVTSVTIFVIWLNNHNKEKYTDGLTGHLNNLEGELSLLQVNYQFSLPAYKQKERRIPSIGELNLYDSISNEYDIGTLSEFLDKIKIPDRRLVLYNKLFSDGYNLGTFAHFEQRLGFEPAKTQQYFSKRAYLNRWITEYKANISAINIKSQTELSSLFLTLFIVFSIIFYPLRFLVISLIWAFKTLRTK
ncbi:MAG: hypothetical protein NTU98_08025 [Bacteroidetes bacterium]|nr:hypothetical protein [Bacteroidota bacterium]